MIEVLISNKFNYLLLIICYFIGSIPFGYIFYKIIKKDDIRNHGSGNIGATNVNRLIGKKFGILTLILDFFKTFFPCLVMHKYLGTEVGVMSGFFTILGHIFPIWLKFRGGKGVATYVGILFSINILIGIIFITCWAIIFLMSKYSSLSSIIASLSIPIYLMIADNNYSIIFFIIMFVLIFFTHRENVKRLKNKEESKSQIY